VRAGANLPTLWCDRLLGREPIWNYRGRAGVRYRWENGELRYLIQEALWGNLGSSLSVLRPYRRVVHAYFELVIETPLRVLLLTNMYPTEEEPWYGCFVRDQVEDLRGLGIEIRLLNFDGRGQTMNYFRAARQMRRIISQERVDLIHAHYGLTGAVAAFQHRIPVVTTFHGSDYTGAVPWQRYVSWFVSRRSLSIFVSEEGRRALGRPSAPVIPAGVDTDLFQPTDRRRARSRLGWDEDASYILLPGSRSASTKRVDVFDAVVTEVRQAVPAVRTVALEGFGRKQAALVFNAVDVTLLTSDREGSPVSVRESLACLTPVVSVEAGDVPQVIAGLPGCGIFPRQPKALARGVLNALGAERHPDLRRRAEQTSRRQIAQRIAAVYESLIGAGPQ
jgi:glycosyltransferase involved in cell wall biosynthesis